jgi:hypothetical protein
LSNVDASASAETQGLLSGGFDKVKLKSLFFGYRTWDGRIWLKVDQSDSRRRESIHGNFSQHDRFDRSPPHTSSLPREQGSK